MNREDAIEAIKQDTYPAFLPQYECIPRNTKRTPDILGKVTAVDCTSDKDRSSACFYVRCTPDDIKWIDFLKKRNGLEEKPEQNYTNHILYNKGENKMSFHSNEDNTTMQCDIDYADKKDQLIREQRNKEYELKAEYEKDLAKIRGIYSQAMLDLEKEYEASKIKEKANEYTETVRAYYDGYIRQGFSEKQADNFIKIILGNQSS